MPKISVIMPAYNAEKYISEAIESILSQTNDDFEFIIVDDGSVDSTYKIANSYKDKRIILFKFLKNQGNYPARNFGIRKSVGKYICVMDSDDIAPSDRLEIQFDFMETNIDYGICGGEKEIIGTGEKYKPPYFYDDIKVKLINQMAFVHSTLMIRHSFLKKFKLNYNETFKYAADYDLVVRSAKYFPITNIQKVLVKYRKHPQQISQAHVKEQISFANLVRLSQLKNFNLNATKKNSEMHLFFTSAKKIETNEQTDMHIDWSNVLLKSNFPSHYYDSTCLSLFLRNWIKYKSRDFNRLQRLLI